MSLNLDFKVQKEQKVREIEDSLQNYLPKQKGYQKIIMEAMGYSLLAGGKRLLSDVDEGDLYFVRRSLKSN